MGPADDELNYLRRVEAAAHLVADRAMEEGWLALLEDEPTATPLHASINELARRLKSTHFEGDGCVDH